MSAGLDRGTIDLFERLLNVTKIHGLALKTAMSHCV